MKCDVTRDSFHRDKYFTRVLMQQGRVQLDADWNEQVAIFWNYFRTLTADLLGPYAGPEENCGFSVLAAGDVGDMQFSPEDLAEFNSLVQGPGDFLIGPGHYYVDGLFCENTKLMPFSLQGHHRESRLLERQHSPYLIYLDAWEQYVSQDEDAGIGEPALRGADTCGRAKAVWQVRSTSLKKRGHPLHELTDGAKVRERWREISRHLNGHHRGYLRAKAGIELEGTATSAAGYRGPENQLYRVEIHNSGEAASTGFQGATFKWSRENGSVVFPIVAPMEGNTVTLGRLGRDGRSNLRVGDWVEIADDNSVLQNRAEPLLQVEQIDMDTLQVNLKGPVNSETGQNMTKHPVLRRWDHQAGDPKKGGSELSEGAVVIREGESDRQWLLLEDGVQVQFQPSKSDSDNHYRTGDYWLIPARTATANVEWPYNDRIPRALAPHGVDHRYAPLAIVDFDGSGNLCTTSNCRLTFKLPLKFPTER